MAYEVHYQIDFVALRTNDVFRLEILKDGTPDSVIHLRGAENPIETTEDNTDDIFSPIRKQTGHLRIADNGYDLDGNEFDYTDILPLDTFDHQVRLWQVGGTDVLRWIGYIKPDTLTSRLFEAVSIREFQIVCPLGCLYETHVSFSNTKNNQGTVKTMGQILYTALDSLGVDWANVYKQNNVQGRTDLTAKVSLLNFISNNEPTHTTPPEEDIDAFTSSWSDESTSWGNLVEEVCKFWGWVLYSRGYDLYIITPSQIKKFAQITFSSLNNISGSMTDISDIEIDIDDLGWASTNHTECRRLGYRDIKIESNVNEGATVLDPDYSKADMSYWPVASDPNQIIHQSNDYLYVLRRMGEQSGQQNVMTQFLDNFQIYENRILQTSTLITDFVIHYSDGWGNEEFKTKTAFNFRKGICCYKGGQSGAITFFAKTLEDICVPLNSVICIQANAALSFNPDPDYPSTSNTAPPYQDSKPTLKGRPVTVALKIGDYWWDNENGYWTTTQSSFVITIKEDGSIATPSNTFSAYGFNPTGILFDDHNGSSGFCIYVTPETFTGSGICGRLKLIIYAEPYAAEPTTWQYNCVLNSLAVSIYNQDSKLTPKAKGSHEYKGIGSVNFHNNLNVSLSMASGSENTYGLGQVYDSQIRLLSTVPFRTSQYQYENMQPEKKLLGRMRGTYSSVIMQDTIEVVDDMQASSPRAILNNHWSGTDNFRPLCCSHNWREGTMKLTIIDR